MPQPVYEYVLGLYVPVYEACRVRRSQTLGHLAYQQPESLDAHVSVADELLERAAIDEFKDQVVVVLARPAIEKGHQIGMI